MVAIEIKEAELQRAISKVKSLGDVVTVRKRKAALRKAALIIRDEARQRVPVAAEVTRRYSTPKLSGKLRAPKGQGNVVEEYQPGTLRNDLNVKSLRRSPDLFVGVGTGTKRATAYWAAWIEFGTRHIRPHAYMRGAVAAKKEAALAQAVADFERLYEREIAKLKE